MEVAFSPLALPEPAATEMFVNDTPGNAARVGDTANRGRAATAARGRRAINFSDPGKFVNADRDLVGSRKPYEIAYLVVFVPDGVEIGAYCVSDRVLAEMRALIAEQKHASSSINASSASMSRTRPTRIYSCMNSVGVIAISPPVASLAVTRARSRYKSCSSKCPSGRAWRRDSAGCERSCVL